MNVSKRNAIETQIKQAFAGVTLGSGISIRQSVAIDGYGESHTAQEFAALPLSEITTDWLSVPLSELETICTSHLDAEGFRYYIPALILSLHQDHDYTSLRVIGTISALCPSIEYMDSHLRHYALLNSEQRSAIANWLAIAEHLIPLATEDRAMIQAAIEDYWHQFT